MDKMTLWMTRKSYRHNMKRWTFILVVLFLGLSLINTTLIFIMSGQAMLSSTFTDNNNLKWMEVRTETRSTPFPLRQIVRNKSEEYVMFPHYDDGGTRVMFFSEDDLFTDVGLALPYDALAYFGITGVSRETWENEDIVLLNQTFLAKHDITLETKLSIPVAKSKKLMDNTDLSEEQLSDQLEALLALPPIVPQLRLIEEEIQFSKFKDVNLMPLDMVYRHNARSNDESLRAFMETEDVEEGAIVIVKNFDQIENVANTFKSQGFSVDYALEDFTNLSQILSTFSKMMLLLMAFVTIIITITIGNNLFQFFSYKQREVGLYQSLGINKHQIIATYVLEVLINGVIVFALMFPIIYFGYQAIAQYFLDSLMINSPLFTGIENMSLLIFGLNIVLVLVILLCSTMFCLYKILQQPTTKLLNNND